MKNEKGKRTSGSSRGLVKQAVALHHVVDDATLTNLLALELRLLTQVVTIVVTKMVVAGDAERLDTGVDKELGEDTLEFGLTTLQVVTTDEGVMTLGEIDDTGNEGVLRSAVDEGGVLEDGSYGEDGGRRDFGVRILDSGEEVVGGIVDASDDVAVALGVRSPEHNDTIQIVLSLELADIGPNVLEMSELIGT